MPAPEIPPLGKFVVQEYDGKDAAYPIIVQVRDPKIGGYVLPAIFSTCPDSRYSATHVYVGPVPTSVDTRVLWTYMRLPGPWIPFTRYDNNLGPVQGRRRAVAFTTQTASLTVSSKKTYEAKDGSEYVSWETEENYSDGTGAAGNPAFPVLVTDFYDPQRGSVQQAAQVVTATGSEVGSLSIAGGIVTQIRFEPFPENKFLLQKITETWSLASAPSLSGKVLTNEKQIGTLVKKLVAAGTAASAGALIESSRVEPVNAIWSEENTVTVPEVFDESEQTLNQVVDIPAKFIASGSDVTDSTIIAATTATPEALGTGGAGIVQSSAKRITKFEVRKTKRTKTLTTSAVTEHQLVQGLVVPVTSTLLTSPSAPTANYLTLVAETSALGGGQYDQRVGAAASYPPQYSQQYDEVLDAVVASTITTVALGADATNRTEITPLDYVKQRKSVITVPTAALNAYLREFPSRTDQIRLPKVLTGITVVYEKDSGNGSNTTTGFALQAGNSGNVSTSAPCSAEASANIVPEIYPSLKSYWTVGLPTTDYYFFLPNPVTEAAILAKVNASAWPVFTTADLTFVLRGQKKSIRANADARCSISWSDSGVGYARSSSQGVSRDVQSTIKAVTIEDIIVQTGATISGNVTDTQTAQAVASSNISTGGIADVSATSPTANISVAGSIVPTTLAASPVQIPTSGRRLLSSRVSNYKYGYCVVEATVFDFANL